MTTRRSGVCLAALGSMPVPLFLVQAPQRQMPSSSTCGPVRRLVTVIRAGQPAVAGAARLGRSVRPTLMLIWRSSKKPPLGPTGPSGRNGSSRAVDPRDRVAARGGEQHAGRRG